MKLITRDTDYAVRALLFMAKRKDELISASELVKELKFPRPFLRKILQKLNKNDVLASSKGQAGGFSLAIRPERIFLADLIKIFQGTLGLNECLFKKRICPQIKSCLLKSELKKIEEEVVFRLKSISIGSLLK